MARQSDNETTGIYQIRLCGHLDSRWSDWFDHFKMKSVSTGTLLIGYVPDQAALHGVLAKIRDLGLEILLVEKMGSPGKRNKT